MPSIVAARRSCAGATVWFTGLSGAGKSTLASAVREHLTANGLATEMLDGDELRRSLSADLGFSRHDRETHVRRVGFVAELLSKHGVITLVPVIAPYANARDDVRSHHDGRDTTYIEVHVATPLAECARRDPKGLYARATSGELSGFTGIDDPYEEPENPELRLDTTDMGVTSAANQVMWLLENRGVIQRSVVGSTVS